MSILLQVVVIKEGGIGLSSGSIQKAISVVMKLWNKGQYQHGPPSIFGAEAAYVSIRILEVAFTLSQTVGQSG